MQLQSSALNTALFCALHYNGHHKYITGHWNSLGTIGTTIHWNSLGTASSELDSGHSRLEFQVHFCIVLQAILSEQSPLYHIALKYFSLSIQSIA